MAFWNRRKKENEEHKGDLMVAEGIYLKQATMKNGNIVLNCFLRALIVFFLVLGSMGGFLSAFDISYNYVLVIAVFLVLSMYFSFLYASSKLIYRDFGYIVFFAIFVGAIYVLRIYANSGFYVIVNDVLEQAQIFFNLPAVRDYEVQIDNDFVTVSIVISFLGMVMIMILNIWMYSIMSMFWTVLFTFPLLFIPIYMKLSPDLIYMVFLAVGYMAVMIFKANGHYVVFAWDAPFKTRGLRRKRVTYTQDSGIFRQIILSLLAFAFCVVLLTNAIMNPFVFERQFKSNRLWSKTSEAIGNFLLLGFSSMYNRYPSTGGMSGGKLGGVSNVRPDYLTDLQVYFVPYGNEAVYLKAYTGGIYGDNQWISIYDEAGRGDGDDQAIFEEESLKRETDKLITNWGVFSGTGRMKIRNIGADPSYLYYPYYTRFQDYSIYNNHGLFSSSQGIPAGSSADYYFYPKIVWENELGQKRPADMDVSEVSSIFKEVPEKNRETMEQICSEIGLNESMTENEIVDAVIQFFAEKYPYTLRPGMTPDGEDFVNYFLLKNKKGYCAHFASSATLIFRYMGIPARYIEGYAFSMETVFASDSEDALDPEEYYTGYSALGDAPVMRVDVPDANAHAWVEIYVDGFGWKTVEVTPGSNEETDEDDFWSAFSDLLQGGLNPGDADGGNNNALSRLNLQRFAWIIYAVLGVVTVGILIMYIRILIRRFRRYRLCHQKNRRDAVIARYADLCDMLRIVDREFDQCRSHREQLEYMGSRYEVEFNIDSVKTWLEQMSFHDDYLDEEKLNCLCELIEDIRKQIVKCARFRMRMKLWRR